MKNPINIVRNAGVAEVSEVQATGGEVREVAPVQVRQPTEKDAIRVGQIWHAIRGLKKAKTAAEKAYLARLGPKSYFRDAEATAKANEEFNTANERYAIGMLELRQELDEMPPGVTPKGWTFPGVDAVTAIIADGFGLVGTNADRVLRGKDVSAVLKAAFPSA